MTTTSDKYTSNAVALIIGVNDYTAFDSEGKSDLRGSLNDVEAVVDFCTWRLGMDVHNVKALNDPTEAVIFEKIKWLKEELSSGDKQGLLWYSGHGAHSAKEGLLLCPTDTTKDYKNTVAFKELGRRLGTNAAKNLTVVLDCCHGGQETDAFGRPSTTLGGPILAKELNSSDLKIGAVVLTACAVGERSQQSRFGGKWHGAFTWALLSVASQWQRVRQGENLRLDLTYRELVKKATVLLDALEFPASPQIYPRTAGALSVMQMGETLLSTSITPDANRAGIQMDPGMKGYCIYKFSQIVSGATIEFAQVLVVKDASPDYSGKATSTYKANTEYWFIKSPPVAGLNITVTSSTTATWSTDSDPMKDYATKSRKSTASDASWGEAGQSTVTDAWQVDTTGYYFTWNGGYPVWFAKDGGGTSYVLKSATSSTLTFTRSQNLANTAQKTTNRYA